MTLWDLRKNQHALITSMSSSINDEVIHRLHEMGLDIDNPVLCVKRGPMGGPIVIQLGDSVFAIEHNLASNISVSVIKD